MLDYIKGGFLLVMLVALFSSFGLALTKENRSFCKNVLVGYIVYSFLSALLLIPIQIFKLPWLFALVSIICMSLGVIGFSYLCMRQYKLVWFEGSFKDWFKQYYFLFVIALILFLIYLLQFDLIWINNHLDDGYYLIKPATLPYLEDPFNTTYATGLVSNLTGFDSYALSSYELEASVFIYLSQIDPVIYCRAVLNIFNYFLAACSIYVLAKEIIDSLKLHWNSYRIQYLSMVLMIFAFEYTILNKTGLLVVQDSWQFASAMWYGSSIVRVMGMMWLVTPYLKISRLTYKEILEVVMISIVLISKSAIALPVIFISCIGYLIAYLITHTNKKMKFIGLLIVGFVIITGFILPDVSQRNRLINEIFISNRFSILLWGSLLVIVLAYFYFQSIVVKRLLIIVFISFGLMAIPEINDIFEMVSMYDFVARRAQTTLIYTLVIIAFIFFFLFVQKCLSKHIVLVQWASFVLLVTMALLSFVPVYGNPLSIYKTMAINNRLMPISTVQLSKALNELSSLEDPLNVMLPEWVIDSNHRHSLAVMIRTYAPYANSISAIGRYGVKEGSEFSSFTLEDQAIYNAFLSSPSAASFEALSQVLNEYPINCLVFPTNCFDEYDELAGFHFEKQVGPYYIYTK